MINKPRPGNWSPTDKTNTSLSFEYQTSLSTRHTDQIMKHTEADSWQHWSRHHTTRLLNPYLLSTGSGLGLDSTLVSWRGCYYYQSSVSGNIDHRSPSWCQEGDDRPQNTDPGLPRLKLQCRGCSEAARGRGPSLPCRDHLSQFTGLTTQHYRNVFMQHFTF